MIIDNSYQHLPVGRSICIMVLPDPLQARELEMQNLQNFTKSRVTKSNLDKNSCILPSPSVVILIFEVRPTIFCSPPNVYLTIVLVNKSPQKELVASLSESFQVQ